MNMTESLFKPELKAVLAPEMASWRNRIDQLDRMISKLKGERDDLIAKLEAAQTLLGERVAGKVPIADMSIKDAVLAVLADGAARSPGDIREDLKEMGYDATKVSSFSPAFYNALSRLTTIREIVKQPDGKYRIVGEAES